MISFPTWSRCVNGVIRESILDHIYCSEPTSITDINSVCPLFGDHLMLIITINLGKPKPKLIWRRNWRHYSKDNLCHSLAGINWHSESSSVQDFWNNFENKLAGVIDNLIPVSKENKSFTSIVPPPMVKNKINLRKRLLKRNRLNKNPETKQRINELNIEIRKFFNENKSKQVRRTIKPGDSQSLWKAVRNAKDTNTSTLPKCMFLDGIEISNSSLPDSFASHFDSKISALLNEVSVDD